VAHPVIQYIESPAELSYTDEEIGIAFEAQRQAEHLEAEQIAAREAAEMERVNALLKEKNWQALSLPSPMEAVQKLYRGETLSVAGHRVCYAPEEGITWIINPYGQEGPLMATPNTLGLEAFLAAMARGRTYGAVPE